MRRKLPESWVGSGVTWEYDNILSWAGLVAYNLTGLRATYHCASPLTKASNCIQPVSFSQLWPKLLQKVQLGSLCIPQEETTCSVKVGKDTEEHRGTYSELIMLTYIWRYHLWRTRRWSWTGTMAPRNGTVALQNFDRFRRRGIACGPGWGERRKFEIRNFLEDIDFYALKKIISWNPPREKYLAPRADFMSTQSSMIPVSN